MLTCELCGNHNLIKSNGIYTCQNCGAKYTPEEARKLLGMGDDRNCQSTPKDNPPKSKERNAGKSASTTEEDSVKNAGYYVGLAKAALEQGAYTMAAEHCKQAFEQDNEYWEAWYLAGRIECEKELFNIESVPIITLAFCKALELAPEEKTEWLKNDVLERASQRFKTQYYTVVCSYARSGQSADADSLIETINALEFANNVFKSQAEITLISAENRREWAEFGYNHAVRIWNTRVFADYNRDSKIDMNILDSFISNGDAVVRVIETIIKFDYDSIDSNTPRYKNLVIMERELINAHTTKNNEGQWVVDCVLTQEEKDKRAKKIEAWEGKIVEQDPQYRPTGIVESAVVTPPKMSGALLTACLPAFIVDAIYATAVLFYYLPNIGLAISHGLSYDFMLLISGINCAILSIAILMALTSHGSCQSIKNSSALCVVFMLALFVAQMTAKDKPLILIYLLIGIINLILYLSAKKEVSRAQRSGTD